MLFRRCYLEPLAQASYVIGAGDEAVIVDPRRDIDEYLAICAPHGLRIRTHVNGELRQDSTTKQLIFDCFALVEHLSTAFTLEPGDVISTGTPSGVGVAMKPPKYLVPGDVVRIEIEGLGTLENPVIAEPADTQRI